MKIRVAAAQIPVYLEISKNVAVIKMSIDKAGDDRADILLTPEGSLSGYTHLFDGGEADEALSEVTAYARERNIGLALGTCLYEDDGNCYDELRFYLPSGEYLGCHTKTLLCGSQDEVPKGEIEYYKIWPLRSFDYLGIKVGGLICNDMWANPCCTPSVDPNLAKLLAKMGAKIIFHSVNGGRDASEFSQKTCRMFHESHLLMNAFAHNVHIVTVDNAYPLNIGVSSFGGVVSPKGWLTRFPDIGTHVETYEINC